MTRMARNLLMLAALAATGWVLGMIALQALTMAAPGIGQFSARMLQVIN